MKRRFPGGLLLGWVVWVHATSPGGSEWFRVGPDTPWVTRGECDRELAQQADWLESNLKQLERGSSTERHGVVFQTRVGGATYTREFVCLPDTVDPRGPKGK